MKNENIEKHPTTSKFWENIKALIEKHYSMSAEDYFSKDPSAHEEFDLDDDTIITSDLSPRLKRAILSDMAQSTRDMDRRMEDYRSEKRLNEDDLIPGGLGDKKKVSDFDPKQLKMGIEVEMEHTNNKKVAIEIVKDHLTEDPEYYTKLSIAQLEEEQVVPFQINFSKMRGAKVNESFVTQFGSLVKIILQRAMGNQGLPDFKVNGRRDEIQAFAKALAGEREYMKTYVKLGLTDPSTINSKHELDKWIANFEKATGVKWPIK
jgi:hypothetical protein